MCVPLDLNEKNNEAKMAGKLGKHKGHAAQIYARGLEKYTCDLGIVGKCLSLEPSRTFVTLVIDGYTLESSRTCTLEK